MSTIGESSISGFKFARVGTGQMSDCYRIDMEYLEQTNVPKSVILKVASQDATSFQTGESLGLYRREVFFYQQIAPLLTGLVPQAYCASYDNELGSFSILLEDLKGAYSGSDITGATLDQAKASLKLLGNMHAKMLLGGVEGYSWLKREQPMAQSIFQSLFDGFVARFRDVLTVEQLGVCAQLVSCYDAYKKQQGEVCVQGVIHGDFRLDNILFGAPESASVAVDWQTIQWAPIIGDVAYFLGGSLSREQRRAHFDELLRVYHDALGANPPMTLEKLQSDIRHESFFGIVMLICSCMMVKQTERGDVMFATMLKRHCDFVLDLDAVAILPLAAQPPVLQPLPTDEYIHPRGREALFNESYYFDFVDQHQGIAGYVRLGITPNSSTGGWYLAVLTRNGKPLVSVMDYEAPIADEMLQVCGQDYKAGFEVVEPLKMFKVTLQAIARLHADVSTVFKGDEGVGAVDLALNMSFRTDGTPYKYRVATRYEIPCLVDGTVSVDGETFNIVGQAGQRDHSWGVRNWWNMDWFWGGIHLDDGMSLFRFIQASEVNGYT